MTNVEPVERAARMIARRLATTSPQRLPDVRRAVSEKLRPLFVPACALAIQRGWVVRIDSETLIAGAMEPDMDSRQGLRGGLAAQLDAELNRVG